MKIKTQVNGALGLIVGLLIIISVGGYSAVNIVKQAGEVHPQILIPGIQNYASLRYGALNVELAVYQKDAQQIARLAKELTDPIIAFGLPGEPDSPFFGDVYLDEGVADISEKMLAVVTGALREDLTQDPSEQFKAAAMELGGLEAKANDIIQHIIDSTTVLISDAIAMIMKLLLIVASVAVVISIGMGFMLTRRMSKSIDALQHSFRQISEGDLTAVADDSTKDEFGEIAGYFNVLAGSLKSTIGELSGMMTTLSELSSRFRSSGEQFRDRAQQTSDETQQVATAMTEMAATIREVAQNAESTSKQAQEASEQAMAARTQVDSSVNTSQKLQGQMGEISSQVIQLKEKTESISSVIDVIQGIAEQTNLLALNAAIEAARAGEQGRGFAVVADEVRTLATRTGDSTQEIVEVIKALQGMAETTAEQITEGQEEVEQNAKAISDIQEGLVSVLNNISSISEMNHQIATNSQEQSHVAEDMNSNVIRISDLSEQNAEQTDQITKDITTIDELMQSVNGLIRKFRF